jgi:hypothetical protein
MSRSYGAKLDARRKRICVPCPHAVVCNPLTVRHAPHQLQGSVYPLLPSSLGLDFPPLARSGFVYATLLACLHPTVCNRQPAQSPQTWTDLVRLRIDGVTEQPEFSEFLCREGHDSSSLMCSRCLDGYWLDGFQCEPCLEGYDALVVLGLMACIMLLTIYVGNRAWISRDDVLVEAFLDSTRAQRGRWIKPRSGAAQTVASTLWYFQVSAAISVSSQVRVLRACSWRCNLTRHACWPAPQINAAHNGNAEQPSEGFSKFSQLLTFRPWAMECLVGPAWTYTLSSALMLVAPWAATAVAMVVIRLLPRWRVQFASAAFVLLDLLYLPVSQRAIEWFNTSRDADVPADGAVAVSCLRLPG